MDSFLNFSGVVSLSGSSPPIIILSLHPCSGYWDVSSANQPGGSQWARLVKNKWLAHFIRLSDPTSRFLGSETLTHTWKHAHTHIQKHTPMSLLILVIRGEHKPFPNERQDRISSQNGLVWLRFDHWFRCFSAGFYGWVVGKQFDTSGLSENIEQPLADWPVQASHWLPVW